MGGTSSRHYLNESDLESLVVVTPVIPYTKRKFISSLPLSDLIADCNSDHNRVFIITDHPLIPPRYTEDYVQEHKGAPTNPSNSNSPSTVLGEYVDKERLVLFLLTLPSTE
jgi:hypothetical protein